MMVLVFRFAFIHSMIFFFFFFFHNAKFMAKSKGNKECQVYALKHNFPSGHPLQEVVY